MIDSKARGFALAAFLAGFSCAVAEARNPLSRPTGEPFAVEATAAVPLDTESSVAIVGIRGQIIIGTRAESELRVVSRGIGADGAERPVGIWQSEGKLVVAPAPGDTGGEGRLQVDVPQSITILLDVDNAEVAIQSFAGGMDFRGKSNNVNVQATTGSLYLEVEGGKLTIRDAAEVTVRARGAAVDIVGVTGSVSVRADAGTTTIGRVDGSTDVESEGGKVVLQGLAGPAHVKAHEGDLALNGTKGRVELELAGTPLQLKECKGDLTVVSDASVDFQAMAASMHLDMYGGSVRGKGNLGILEVRSRNTEVTVESIEQGMRVQGDGLKAQIVDVGGELYVDTSISDVLIDRAASVILRLDRGTATVQRATGAVEATVVEGNVRILDGIGPVTLNADRGDVEVSWASMSASKDSRLVNKGGSITVRFPPSGSCRVEAKCSFGHIDSDLPTVKVMDDATEAQGPVNGGYRPVVHIEANGNIHLLGGGAGTTPEADE